MPAFFGEDMAASSVTGVGLGDSNGKQKPELHSGCGCCGPSLPAPKPAVNKKGCYFSYSARTSSVNYVVNSNTRSAKFC